MMGWLKDGTWGETVRFPDGSTLTSADSASSPVNGWTWAPEPSTSPTPAADALDALAATADASPLAALRDMADQFRTAADALRSQ